MTAGAPAPFDVVLALRRVAIGWHDVVPVVVLGFGMVAVPEVAQALVGGDAGGTASGGHAGGTVVATIAGLLKALYVVIVADGTLARLAGRPLPAADFTRAGIAASPRALATALLLGVGIVVLLSVLVVSNLARAAAPAVRAGVVVAGFAAMVLAVPAVPLALTQPATPWQATTRAAALTRGRRAGVAVVLAIVAVVVVAARAVVAAATVAATGSVGPWPLALFDLFAWSTAAIVAASVFSGLAPPRDR